MVWAGVSPVLSGVSSKDGCTQTNKVLDESGGDAVDGQLPRASF